MKLVLVAPSGGGKTEFCLACERVGIPRVRTNTSRDRRHSDNDDSYNFRSILEFEKLIEDDLLLEYAIYHNNYYGITKDSILETCVVVVEPEGYFALRDEYGDSVFMIYFEVTDSERARRTALRGDNLSSVSERQELDKYIFTDGVKEEADLILTNISLEDIPFIVDKYKDMWISRG